MENQFLPKQAAASLSARWPKRSNSPARVPAAAPARPRATTARPSTASFLSLPLARTAGRPRQSTPATWRPHADAVGRVAPCDPARSTSKHAPTPSCLLRFPFFCFLTQTAAAAVVLPPPPRAIAGVAISATLAHHEPLHLAPNFSSLWRSPRSPQPPVISLPSVGIAHQSSDQAR
jgi:hypothetical protein